jgi:hypothetical protein
MINVKQLLLMFVISRYNYTSTDHLFSKDVKLEIMMKFCAAEVMFSLNELG